MATQRIYHAPSLDIGSLGQSLDQWFQEQGFETQILPASGGGVTVQARTSKAWYLRGSIALAITVTPQGEDLLVQAGSAKWAVQAVSGVAALVVFWPLVALPAYAAIKQKQLIDGAFQFLDRYIGVGGSVPVATPTKATAPAFAPKAKLACPSCNQFVREGAKFCDHCGALLKLACAKCGAALRPEAKFCDNCGEPVEGRKET